MTPRLDSVARLGMPNISRRIEAKGLDIGVVYPLALTLLLLGLTALSILAR